MPKLSLDIKAIKSLASGTRLDILRTLDGKKMSLKDISRVTKLHEVTIHGHLTKLIEGGFVKKHEREGHKWVYYKLTWQGESLLHPENTKIVVLFTTTFFVLVAGIIQLISYVKGTMMNLGYNVYTLGKEVVVTPGNQIPPFIKNIDVSTIPPSVPDFLKDFIPQQGAMQGTNPPPISPNIPYGHNLTWVSTSNSGGITAPLQEGTKLVVDKSNGVINAVYQDPTSLYIAITCFFILTFILCTIFWILWKNRASKL